MNQEAKKMASQIADDKGLMALIVESVKAGSNTEDSIEAALIHRSATCLEMIEGETDRAKKERTKAAKTVWLYHQLNG